MRRRPKLTQEDVISILSGLYPTLDFSESQYTGNENPISAKCPIHGEFTKSRAAAMIYMGQGCPACGKAAARQCALKRTGRKRLTQDEFVKVCQDNLKNPNVSLEKAVFTTTDAYVTVTCKIHGDVKVTAFRLMKGLQDCSACGRQAFNTDRQSMSKEDFFEVVDKHPFAEQIDRSSFTTIRGKIRGICPIHGEYIKPARGVYDGQGCIKCADIQRGKSKTASVKDKNVEKIKEVVGDRYDLSHAKYVNSKKKIILVCREHGSFSLPPTDVVRGFGCPYCSGRLLCPSEFQKQIDDIHGEGRYTCQTFEPRQKKIRVTCNVCNTSFDTYHQTMREGQPCPVCFPPTGFRHDKPGVLYHIEFTLPDGTRVYKVGITNNGFTHRTEGFGMDKGVWGRVLKWEEFLDGHEAFVREQEILRKFEGYRYTGKPFLYSGSTEVLTVNPLTHKTPPCS